MKKIRKFKKSCRSKHFGRLNSEPEITKMIIRVNSGIYTNSSYICLCDFFIIFKKIFTFKNVNCGKWKWKFWNFSDPRLKPVGRGKIEPGRDRRKCRVGPPDDQGLIRTLNSDVWDDGHGPYRTVVQLGRSRWVKRSVVPWFFMFNFFLHLSLPFSLIFKSNK